MKIRFNTDLDITVVDLDEHCRYVVIDDVLANADELVAFAQHHWGEFQYPELAYPGAVLPLAPGLTESFSQFLRREMSRLFSFSRVGLRCQSQLCVTTLQPEQFSWVQRLCHTDPGLYPGKVNFAAVLYLFDEPALGGTAFFRWKDEAYWRKMTARQQSDPAAGLGELESKFALFRNPPCYMSQSNEVADLLDEVPAQFNRLVFYSGDTPHGACIRSPQQLVDDPLRGRLTLNAFVAASKRA